MQSSLYLDDYICMYINTQKYIKYDFMCCTTLNLFFSISSWSNSVSYTSLHMWIMHVFIKLHKLKHFSRPVHRSINYLYICREVSDLLSLVGDGLEIVTGIILVLQIECNCVQLVKRDSRSLLLLLSLHSLAVIDVKSVVSA